MQWLFRFQNCLVTDACECFVQVYMYVCGYLNHNHGIGLEGLYGLNQAPVRTASVAVLGLVCTRA